MVPRRLRLDPRPPVNWGRGVTTSPPSFPLEVPISIPNYKSTIERLAVEYPTEWKNAHTGNAHTEDFIRIAAKEINALEPLIGLNGKRGNPNDISDDALCYLGEGADYVEVEEGVMEASVIDVIGGAGGPNPVPTWNVVSDPSNPIKTAWVDPDDSGEIPEPGPTPEPVQPYPDEQTWWPQVFDVEVGARYAKVGRTYPDNAGAFRWASRTAYDIRDGLTKEESLAKHLVELEQELGLR